MKRGQSLTYKFPPLTFPRALGISMALHLMALAILLTRPSPAVWGPIIPVTLVTLPGLKAPAIQEAPAIQKAPAIQETPAIQKAPAIQDRAKVKETVPLRAGTSPAPTRKEPAPAPKAAAAPVAGLAGPMLPPGMQDSPFSFYFQILTDRVNAAWRLPPLEDEFPPTRRTEVSFRILADGGVDAISLRRRSGDGAFDSSALRAVQSAAPFPPLPDGFPDQDLRIVYGFWLKP